MAVETASRRSDRRADAGVARRARRGRSRSLLAPAAASAQSLLELYEAAHAYDATYLAARALADSAHLPRRADARADAAERVALGQRRARRDQPDRRRELQQQPASASRVNGRQPLFNRANDATIAQAERSLESSLADLDTAEQDLMLRVSQAYFDVLGAQDTLQTTRANKAAIAEQLASAKRNFEVGTATITDTREAQARFDLATAQEIAADNDLVTKRIALDQLVGRSNVAAAASSRCRSCCRRRRRSRSTSSSSRAAEEHPSGAPRPRRLRRRPARDREGARAAPADASTRSPRLQSGRGTIARRRHRLQLRRQHRRCRSTCRSTPAARSRTGSRRRSSSRSARATTSRRRAARVTQTTRQAYYTLQSGAAQVKALEAAEASSQLALEATQLGYRVGIRVNVDVLNAQSQLYQTRRDLARARYDLLLATLRLRQASARLTPDVPGDDSRWRMRSSRVARSPLEALPARRSERRTLLDRGGAHARA